MTQKELTILNLGQSLDDLANLDPRGYGVCNILYSGSRQKSKLPLCMNAAQKLIKTVKPGDIVYILTGFILPPWGKAETDGMVGSVLLCRALVKALDARPVIVCPEECRQAAYAMAPCVDLQVCEDLERLRDDSMGLVIFTKDENAAPGQADALINSACPKAVISIECPGANSQGRYHNATGIDVTDMQAKQDVLFEKLQSKGVVNIAIGDLGNEIGMGAIADTLNEYIPYAAKGRCNCGCDGGIAVKTKADNLITATVSDWGCYAMIAAIAYLKEDVDIMHTPELEKRALTCGCENGMIDMYGWLIPAIDGFGLEINMPIVQLMYEMVKSALGLKQTCKTWFEKVEELKFFEK